MGSSHVIQPGRIACEDHTTARAGTGKRGHLGVAIHRSRGGREGFWLLFLRSFVSHQWLQKRKKKKEKKKEKGKREKGKNRVISCFLGVWERDMVATLEGAALQGSFGNCSIPGNEKNPPIPRHFAPKKRRRSIKPARKPCLGVVKGLLRECDTGKGAEEGSGGREGGGGRERRRRREGEERTRKKVRKQAREI